MCVSVGRCLQAVSWSTHTTAGRMKYVKHLPELSVAFTLGSVVINSRDFPQSSNKII